MAYEGESTVSTGTVAALERVVIARKTNQKNARLQTKGVNLIETLLDRSICGGRRRQSARRRDFRQSLRFSRVGREESVEDAAAFAYGGLEPWAGLRGGEIFHRPL